MGLMKKVSKLCTLCDVKACVIIYSPYDSQPDVWPSPLGAQHMLADFKRMLEMEQSKKMGKSLHQLNLIDLNDLGWLIEQHVKEIQKKMETLNKSPQPQEVRDGGVMKGPSETFTQIKENSR
ncbi:agamous-like MADS-box protein AGL80, partial [Carica papaya]|uniref:agamous-like MADS-box protein AGL80 n=1 Tax=Carica papaya TaxID=3649 RepID=UPI000B8CF55F